MHKIKLLVIIVLILFPLILILSDIYGTFPSVQRKKNTSDFRFKNKEIDNKMVEAEKYLSIWMQRWNEVDSGPAINVAGAWRLILEYISPDYEAAVTITIIIQQKGHKLAGKLFSGRRFESVSFFEGKVFGDKLCAISTAGMETGYLSALVTENKMEGFIVRKRLDGLMDVIKCNFQRIQNNVLQDRNNLFLKDKLFLDLSY